MRPIRASIGTATTIRPFARRDRSSHHCRSPRARTVPGVRVAFGRGSHPEVSRPAEAATLAHRHPRAAAGVPGRTAVINLAVAAEYGRELDAIARDVQQRVTTELRDKAGLGDIQVNVTVDDIIT